MSFTEIPAYATALISISYITYARMIWPSDRLKSIYIFVYKSSYNMCTRIKLIVVDLLIIALDCGGGGGGGGYYACVYYDADDDYSTR